MYTWKVKHHIVCFQTYLNATIHAISFRLVPLPVWENNDNVPDHPIVALHQQPFLKDLVIISENLGTSEVPKSCFHVAWLAFLEDRKKCHQSPGNIIESARQQYFHVQVVCVCTYKHVQVQTSMCMYIQAALWPPPKTANLISSCTCACTVETVEHMVGSCASACTTHTCHVHVHV